MIRRLTLLFIIFFSTLTAFSQAGFGVYQFLELPASSRLTALGSTNISLRDGDINFAFTNPALLTKETSNVLGLNMSNYLADIRFGSAIYGRNFGDKNFFSIGVQYVDYGTFLYATETNVVSGQTFTGKDMAINLSYARPLTDKITVGATLKPINSVLEQYSSFGLAMDLGASYNDSKNFFSAGLVVRNIGSQLNGYYSDGSEQHYEPLPINVQLGLSKKFAHAPLRLSLTLHNIQHWKLNYESTNQTSTSLNSTTSSSSNSIKDVDMAFRHTIWAAEFIPSKNFYLAASYNHRRHKEMLMDGFKSMAGFSFGGGIKVYKFHVGFGWSEYTAGNDIYHFSISTALNEFRL